MKKSFIIFALLPFLLTELFAQVGTVKSHSKISATQGGFLSGLQNHARFGCTVVPIGDLDGDGVVDIAVGAHDHESPTGGAMFILFLDSTGSVKSEVKIASMVNGFNETLQTNDQFGVGICNLGDVDGDGITDLAVGANLDDDGNYNAGAVYILFLNVNGSVKAHQKISSTKGGFNVALDVKDYLGNHLASIGDLNGDSVPDFIATTNLDDDGGPDKGAVYVIFLNPNGTVNSTQKISALEGNFLGLLSNGDRFGNAVTNIGDYDGNGTNDIAVSARYDDDGGADRGAIWLLTLNPNGTVSQYYKISSTTGGFSGIISNDDQWGTDLSAIGDIDGDAIVDIIVGAWNDDDGGTDIGAAWILFMNANGTVKSHQKISAQYGGFLGMLDSLDQLAYGLSIVPDINGDGVHDLIIGGYGDDDGGIDRGALWVLFLNRNDNPLTITTAKSNITCHSIDNGTAVAIPSGGTAPYSYYWNTNPISTTSSISNLPAGNYTCFVTDSLGTTVTKEVEIINPPQLNGYLIINSPNPGGLNLLVSGGINPYTYNWSNGNTTEDLQKVSPGFYFCQISDFNGCASLVSITISP